MSGSLRLEGEVLKVATKMLHVAVDIFKKSGLEYIVETGTLLGIVRENRLLPWDNDVDFTVTEDQEEKLLSLKWKFIMKGYRFRIKRFKKDVGPFKKGSVRVVKITTRRFIFFKKYGLIDIFIKRTLENDKDNYYWTFAVKNPVLKSTPRRFYDERSTLVFQNKEISCPKDYEGYLKYYYGDDWRTPVKKWDFRLSDDCKTEIL